jgi:phosphatidylserine decarboxylase
MNIAKEGWPFITIPLLAGIIFLFPGRGLLSAAGFILITLGLFSAFFFRDPMRTIPPEEHRIISPADGKIMEVTEADGQKVVRIFLSVFNVHLQRAPISGTVTKVEYRPGKFLPAMDPKAHQLNEQNAITIATPKGDVTIVQIAGILARRIISYPNAGDAVVRGQKVGLIRFGSQVDIYMPLSCTLNAKPGDVVVGGETILGEI